MLLDVGYSNFKRLEVFCMEKEQQEKPERCFLASPAAPFVFVEAHKNKLDKLFCSKV
jgi:hypothetical protein